MTGPRRILFLLAGVAWLAAVGVGMATLWEYAYTEGAAAAPPETWPVATKLAPTDADRPTLVLFVHPHCPCSRATVDELARLMTACRGRLDARVAFLKPAGFDAAWVETDTWRSAAAIPGVTVSYDEAGAEAKRFGALTSGQALLYDARGRLLFRGGITAARGHAGDSAGQDALISLVMNQAPLPRPRTPVYGCSLVDPEACAEPQDSDHENTP